MTAQNNRAEVSDEIVEELFSDLRDRRFLKWLFKEEEAVIGDFPALRSLDIEVQEEIKEAWKGIISKALSTSHPEPTSAVQVTERHGIYIASKTKHAHRWRFLRDKVGEQIISTWIDEAGEGESHDLADLWRRCIHEASHAQVLILYREPDEVLKGGWIELGAALASGVKVFAVGIDEFTVAHDGRIEHVADMKSAIAATRSYLANLSQSQPAPTTALHGPYGWLNGCRGLSEDSWELEGDPLENNDEYFSIPLYVAERIRNGRPNPVERFLAELRDTHPNFVRIYTQGGCYQLHKILRTVWPHARPWSDLNHVWTEIDGAFYDIEGRHLVLPKQARPMEPDVEARAHRWHRRTFWRKSQAVPV